MYANVLLLFWQNDSNCVKIKDIYYKTYEYVNK